MNTREIILLELVVALFLRELAQLRRKKWFIQWLSALLPKPKALQTPKIRQMKPKSEKDCPFCQKEQAGDKSHAGVEVCPHTMIPWSEMKKGKGGRSKRSTTEGHACLEPNCTYSGITDQTIHALVATGRMASGKRSGIWSARRVRRGFLVAAIPPCID